MVLAWSEFRIWTLHLTGSRSHFSVSRVGEYWSFNCFSIALTSTSECKGNSTGAHGDGRAYYGRMSKALKQALMIFKHSWLRFINGKYHKSWQQAFLLQLYSALSPYGICRTDLGA